MRRRSSRLLAPILWLALFAGEEARAQDHGAFERLLAAHVREGRVDYQGLAAKGAELDTYVQGLAGVSLASTTRAHQMAFWINAYNALTLDLIVDSLPLHSIMDLDGGKVWDTRTWTVAGRQVTLNQIEHTLLRPLNDPRIHAAINCASLGCPSLRPRVFTEVDLDGQLTQTVAAWAVGNGLTVTADKVGVNRIFDWFGEDFTSGYGPGHFDIPGVDGKPEAAINFLLPHLPVSAQQQLRAGGYVTYWSVYDWALNGQ